MSGTGNLAPAPPGAETGSTDTHPLFARKGGAAPTGATGKPPVNPIAIDEPDGDGALPCAQSTAPPNDHKMSAALPPAASLDAPPFDPAHRKPLAFDDKPKAASTGADTISTSSPEDSAPAPARASLQTMVLTGAAAAAAIAAVITAASWYDFSVRPAAPEPAAGAVPATPADRIRTTAPLPAAAPAAVEPSAPIIDLVRLEPDGSTVIAGRAEPGTALVVLDNDIAIGTVTVGAAGDWMLTPANPLAGGEHEIALAIKTRDGSISVAAPPAAKSGASGPPPAGSTDGTGRFVVQIASVRTPAGAAQEWAKLQAALPDVLGGLTPNIDPAEVRDRGTFYRIRIGPFSAREDARALCAALDRAGRDCLVLRR